MVLWKDLIINKKVEEKVVERKVEQKDIKTTEKETIDHEFKRSDKNLGEIVLKHLKSYNRSKINELVEKAGSQKIILGKTINISEIGLSNYKVKRGDSLSKIIFEELVKDDYNYRTLLKDTIELNKTNDSNFDTRKLKNNQIIKLPVL